VNGRETRDARDGGFLSAPHTSAGACVGQSLRFSHAEAPRRRAERTQADAGRNGWVCLARRLGGSACHMVFGLWVLAQAVGAHADLNVQIEPESVAVAEPVVLTLTSDGGAVVWPDWAEALPGWQVVPVSVTETEARLSLRSWLPGEIAIPALTAGTPGGVTFATEPRTVTVNSVLPDDADVADVTTLRDSAGAVPTSDPKTSWQLGVAGGVIVALVLGGGVLLLWKFVGPPEDSPEERIDKMVGEATQYRDVALASAAVRQSVEQLFGIKASRQTTKELEKDQRLLGTLGRPLHEKVIELLNRIDEIRYANATDDRWAASADSGQIIRELRAVAARERSRGGKP